MELRTYLREVWRYVVFIVLAVVVSAVIAFAATSAMENTYTAESRLVVTAGLGTEGGSTDSVLMAPRVGQTYAVLATTRPILLEVIRRAGLPYDPTQLLTHLTVVADLDTPFLAVTMIDPDRTRAAATANMLGDVLVDKASIPATATAPAGSLLAIVERATVPEDPTGPRVLFNTILAAATALILGLVIISLLAYLRNGPDVPSSPQAG
jgi:capsular polysaccharide biosynthesis protein